MFPSKERERWCAFSPPLLPLGIFHFHFFFFLSNAHKTLTLCERNTRTLSLSLSPARAPSFLGRGSAYRRKKGARLCVEL